ncbi:MAG: hypothetical protein HN764_04315 [Gammaproteobacteria bacterium]|nr:hypothetical protein [Gammaproteobacteria bacterium]
MNNIGHGERQDLEADAALAIAKASIPGEAEGVDEQDPLQLQSGDDVIVEPDDYGKVPVQGVLINLNRQRVSIRRKAEDVGELNVHFPRAGFRITKAV